MPYSLHSVLDVSQCKVMSYDNDRLLLSRVEDHWMKHYFQHDIEVTALSSERQVLIRTYLNMYTHPGTYTDQVRIRTFYRDFSLWHTVQHVSSTTLFSIPFISSLSILLPAVVLLFKVTFTLLPIPFFFLPPFLYPLLSPLFFCSALICVTCREFTRVCAIPV